MPIIALSLPILPTGGRLIIFLTKCDKMLAEPYAPYMP